MLGFTAGLDLNDFVEDLTNFPPKTFLKGDQLVCFLYEGNVKNARFPIAFEGSHIF